MDENQNGGFKEKISNMMNSISRGVRKTGRAIRRLFNPLLLKIILVGGGILLVLAFFMAIISAVTGVFSSIFNFSDENNLTSLDGITGKNYYGARVIYYDNEKAKEEIKQDYLTLTYELLKGSNLAINNLGSTFNANNSVVLKITENYANKLANNNTTTLTLDQSAEQIDHFGLKSDNGAGNNEISIMIDSVADTILNEHYLTGSSITKDQIISALNNEMQNIKYSKYKQVFNKIYIKDYILIGDDSTLPKLEKKNYIGFAFMQKNNIEIKNASFVVLPEDSKSVQTTLKHKNGTENSVVEEFNITAEWTKESNIFNDKDISINLSQFSAIDGSTLNYFEQPKSIKTIAWENEIDTYFETQENYTHENIMQSIKTDNMLYLEFNSESEFVFAEFEVTK